MNKIYIADPSWVNHRPILAAAGLDVETYPYYDSTSHGLRFSELCDFLKKLPPKSPILLQAMCHNPTGVDPTKDQWREIAAVMKEKEHFPFLDAAYQGFGHGLEEDVFPIRLFASLFKEMLVAYSVSKNFGLYGERVGALLVHAGHESEAANILSQLRVIVRGSYSSPPSYGANIVKVIYRNQELRALWQSEVALMRERIAYARHALIAGLAARNARLDLEAMAKQVGLFSFIGLGQEQVNYLTAEYGIYLPNSGRINLAGLCADNMEYVLDALMKVIG
jgi:aspartate/tyrosine/aromatic aminotransferase